MWRSPSERRARPAGAELCCRSSRGSGAGCARRSPRRGSGAAAAARQCCAAATLASTTGAWCRWSPSRSSLCTSRAPPRRARARGVSPRQPARAGRESGREAGLLRIAADHVLDEMLRGPAPRDGERAPFEPEAGAYGSGHHHGEHGHARCMHGRQGRASSHEERVAITVPRLLALLQLASPWLPVGAFSYSQGLEAAIEAGLARRRARRRRWIAACSNWRRALEAPVLPRLRLALTATTARRSCAGTRSSSPAARPPSSAPRRCRWATRSHTCSPSSSGVRREAESRERRIRRSPRRSRSPQGVEVSERQSARLSLVVAREPGDGGGEGRAARADRRPRMLLALGARIDESAARPGRVADDASAGFGPGLALRRTARDPRDRCSVHQSRDVATAGITGRPFESASGARWAPARPRWSLALCRRCAIATTSPSSPTTSTPRRTRSSSSRNEALAPERIIGVETGGCPHTAIREDASINLEAVARMSALPGARARVRRERRRQPRATFSPELSDLTLYVIDVAAATRSRARAGRGSRGPISW